MKTLMVGYDLNKPGQNYDDLIKYLKTFAYWHHLDSTWLVKTEESPADVRNALKAYVDGDDEVLVLDVTGDNWATYGIKDSGNDWLHKHL